MASEGPVLIIAGAGTGKTRVIAHRIAHLLESNKDLTPSNILAMTFSRKAAQEMRERVEGLLGAYADELEMLTFHGFCHRFLQDHAMDLGLPYPFQLLDRAESWIFFRSLLPELKLRYNWNLADPAACIAGFLRFIGRAKDELVSPEDYAAYVATIEDKEERARAEEVERAYRIYQKKMRLSGYLDFGDLVVETYRALREKPAVLADLQAKYRYILVDEFQDTNVAQVALLGLLAGAKGNLCVVGDDDQAIYRFRGASFASFLLMKEVFQKVRTIRLTQNYRTTRRILSVTGRLIKCNEPDRYDPEKHLRTENPEGVPVEVVVCHDDVHEAQLVVEMIRALCESQPAEERRFDRIAVLYRAHANKEQLVQALRAAGIPFFVQGTSSLFDRPEIKDLLSFLGVLHDRADSLSLFRLFSHPIWGIPSEDLISINRAAKEGKVALRDVLAGTVKDLSVSAATKAAVAELLQEIGTLERRVARSRVGELVLAVAEQTFLRTIFRLPGTGDVDPMASLGRFLRFTYRYDELHPRTSDLGAFLWYVDSYIQSGGEPAEEEQGQAGNQVRLMSIHQAKGLEFDWVVLLGMVQGRFPSRTRREVIPFPVGLMKERLPAGDYHLQEERRLCYVACTRAKRGLFLMTRERAYHRSSVFIREMLEGISPGEIVRRESAPPESAPSREVGHPTLFAAASLAAEREILRVVQRIKDLDPEDEEGFQGALQQISHLAGLVRGESRSRSLSAEGPPLPAQKKFSYTQLETYRYCPLKYKFSYLYQIPVKPTPQMIFGVDIHACLEAFYRQVMNGTVPSLEELVDTFRRCHIPGRYGEPYQDEEYLQMGVRLLTDFYHKQGGNFSPPLFVERSFTLPLGQDSIHGVVDRIDPLPGGGVEIIDYKTGKPKERADEDEQLQLRLYALAAREAFQLEPRRVSFYYLRTNEKLSFEQDPKSIPVTRQKLLDLATEVRSSDFKPTPSPQKCRWCDFRSLCPASMA